MATGSSPASSTTNKDESEIKYLTFQIFVSSPDPAIPVGGDALLSPLPSQIKIENMVKEIIATIGMTRDKSHKLGFTLGPLAFDHTDEEIIRLIRDSFDIARRNNVAVAFHLDDSMFWGKRKDLLKDIDNIEWLDWNKTPNTGRMVDWGPTPTKLMPQMCFNSPAIRDAVKKRAYLIGEEIKKEVDDLKRLGKEELFAGVIVGWEPMIGQDFDTGKPLGYAALSHKGFSPQNLPADINAQRARIIQEFIEWWAKNLTEAGVQKEKLYAHFALPPPPDNLESLHSSERNAYAEGSHFVTPEIFFSPYYHPGISSYPEPGRFKFMYKELAKHGDPAWASAEGTNVIPNGSPGEATMETYLGRTFNHGGTWVNIFAWGIGGESLKKTNFFRIATEGEESIAAYRKFLRGETLIEHKDSRSFSPINLQMKIHRIQREVPIWIQETKQQAKVEPLFHKLDSLIKNDPFDPINFQEADQVANEILELIESK